MKVILLQDVKKLGKKGQVIETAEGYGRNYLIPHGMAEEASIKNLNKAKQSAEVLAIEQRKNMMKQCCLLPNWKRL